MNYFNVSWLLDTQKHLYYTCWSQLVLVTVLHPPRWHSPRTTVSSMVRAFYQWQHRLPLDNNRLYLAITDGLSSNRIQLTHWMIALDGSETSFNNGGNLVVESRVSDDQVTSDTQSSLTVLRVAVYVNVSTSPRNNWTVTSLGTWSGWCHTKNLHH